MFNSPIANETESPTSVPSPAPSSAPIDSPTRQPFELGPCILDDVIFVVDSMRNYFIDSSHAGFFTTQQQFLSNVVNSFFDRSTQRIGYFQYDASYNVLVPFDNSWTLSAIVNSIKFAQILHDLEWDANLGYVLGKAIEAFDKYSEPTGMNTLVAVVTSGSNATLDNCGELRGAIEGRGIDFILILVTNQTIHVHTANEPSHGMFSCLFSDTSSSLYANSIFEYDTHQAMNDSFSTFDITRRICNRTFLSFLYFFLLFSSTCISFA